MRTFDRAAGEALADLRRQQGWNRRRVETALGWPPGTLTQMEKGRLGLTLEHAATLVLGYGAEPEALIAAARQAG